MASAAFEDIADNFEFLDDWEDRYRYVIELGKDMPALDDGLKVAATKVDGCASQVWLVPLIEGQTFKFMGDSDAMIVRGLIAILSALYNEQTLDQVLKIDPAAEFARLGLDQALSAQRSNGLRAMMERIKLLAGNALKNGD